MTFYRATVKDLDPLKVLLRGDSDNPANYLDVWESQVQGDALALNDSVAVELQDHMVFLLGRFGGADPHPDVIQEDTTTVTDVAYIPGLRAITITWEPPVGGVGHGYYQVQVTLQTDTLYAAPLRDFSTTDTAVMVVDLTGEILHRFRVRPIGSGGIAGAWVEVQNVEPRDVISTDITEGAVNRAAIEQFAIDSLRLDDDAVSYRTLVVGSFDNLVLDPGFESGVQRDPAPVNAGGTWAVLASSPRSGANALRYNAAAQVAQALYRPLGSPLTSADNIACAQGDVFYLESWFRADAVATYRTWAVGIEFRDAGGALLSSVYQDYAGSSAFVRGSIVGTAPAGVAYCLPILRVNNDGDSTNSYFDDLYMRKRVDGNLIVDGSITAVHLAANSVAAAHIQAGVITASHIASNTITAAQIAVGTITAAEIAANAIGTSELQASVSITSPTIIGGTFRTASSGRRIELTSSDVGTLRMFRDDGTQSGFLQIDGTTGAIKLQSTSTTGNVTLLAGLGCDVVVGAGFGNTNDLLVNGSIYQEGTAVSLTSHTHSTYSLTSHTHGTYSLTSHTHSYLPLSGGTMTGELQVNQLVNINRTSGSPLLYFRASGTYYGELKVTSGHLFLQSPTAALKILGGATLRIQGRNAADSAYVSFEGEAYVNSSDRKFKSDIREVDGMLALVERTKAYKYKRQHQDNRGRLLPSSAEEQVGFMADEMPEFVRRPEANPGDGEGVDLYSLIGVLWSAVQELSARVGELA